MMTTARRRKPKQLGEAANDTPHYVGHRERLRQRLIEAGAEALPDVRPGDGGHSRGNTVAAVSRAMWCRELAKLHVAVAQVAATALNSDGREWMEVAGRKFSGTSPASYVQDRT